MDIGMLWFDDDKKRTLAEKVTRAADYYRAKYDLQPTVCYVHPSTLVDAKTPRVGAITLLPNRTIIKNHFWLGQGENTQVPKHK
jgi:hypothetical protein